MARVPDGGTLVKNAVSAAPGFHIGNVFVMAGVPMVMRAMMEEIATNSAARRAGHQHHGERAGARRRHRRRA